MAISKRWTASHQTNILRRDMGFFVALRCYLKLSKAIKFHRLEREERQCVWLEKSGLDLPVHGEHLLVLFVVRVWTAAEKSTLSLGPSLSNCSLKKHRT